MRFTREVACRIWLSMAEVGDAEYRRLLGVFGCAENVYDTLARRGTEALAVAELAESKRAFLKEASDPQKIHRCLELLQKDQIQLLFSEDAHFPVILRNISNPPWLLYCRGDLNCLLGRHLAVVGARKSSIYGMRAATCIAEELSQNGVTIVSGLAPGIDTAAHEGCMRGTSPTIGFSASGLDRPWPQGREHLCRDILDSGGLLMSEYAPGNFASRHHFPARNRLISGLSDAVLLMEGRIRSGSMLTVSCALDQGKDVFAFPGPVGQEGSEAPLQILREGAILFRNAADILSDMGWEEKVKPTPKALQALPELPPDQYAVLSLLTVEALSFDQLTFQTGMDASRLNAALTLLELSGFIAQSPGRVYHKA